MYKITITEITTKKVVKGEQWEQIRTDAEAERDEKDTYGYTPKIEKDVEVSEEVYKQTVDDLELVDVIAAVNKIREVV
jgi:hypothetical protein